MVFVVDDSPTEAAMARSALEASYAVTVFNDGNAFLEKVASRGGAPDLVVLDWLMPNVTGIEVLEFLRRNETLTALPVLLLTARQETEQIVEGLAAGADDYLCKPFAPAELRARAGALLRAASLRERALAAERRLRKVLAGLPDAVLTVDPAGRVLFVNEQGEKLFGSVSARLVGASIEDLVPGLSLQRLVLPKSGTLPDVTVAGRALSPRVSIPPADDDGNTTISLRDVTELRRSEERRLDFYSMVAHDMRSPLSAMAMRLQMLARGLRGELPAGVHKDLDKVASRVRELIGLLSDFLDVSQLEAGRMQLEREPLDLAAVYAGVLEEYQPLAEARQIALELSCGPDAQAMGDERRICQALANLVSNAIKYSAPGNKVRVRVTTDGEQVRTEVQDEGAGIAPEALGSLFQKWVRAPGSGSRIEGTGLGLAIVREIIEAHGGKVGVESEKGKGSLFWFTVPRAAPLAERTGTSS